MSITSLPPVSSKCSVLDQKNMIISVASLMDKDKTEEHDLKTEQHDPKFFTEVRSCIHNTWPIYGIRKKKKYRLKLIFK